MSFTAGFLQERLGWFALNWFSLALLCLAALAVAWLRLREGRPVPAPA
jgi:hypothetical protein